jgi:hypothetical protein
VTPIGMTHAMPMSGCPSMNTSVRVLTAVSYTNELAPLRYRARTAKLFW